ncbi:branched-chain amino acid ABC transporter permease [Afipia sp. DC4300-2b1]|uniref:branched-chain amino acid ABC transporter permease n=1 Tax=Afipia sp. DC4300-2b1 TaxID=2804672 RepID=UPI003CE83091
MLIVQILNALQLSMLVLILALGLTVIFGLMDTLNLGHGAFYTIGAYAGWLIYGATGSFWVALVLAPIVPGILGALLQYLVFRPLVARGRSSHLDLALITFGMLFVTIGVTDFLFGSTFSTIPLPKILQGQTEFIGIVYPTYRLFIILVGALVGLLVWVVLDRTMVGALVRAGISDRDMVSAMGFDIDKIFAAVFGAGCGLAGFAGVVAAPILSIHPRMGVGILISTLLVVLIGGLGSVRGSIIGAFVVGIVETVTSIFLPEFSMVSVYVLLAAIMIVRPQGLSSTPVIVR